MGKPFRVTAALGHTMSKHGLSNPRPLLALIITLGIVIGLLSIPAAELSDEFDDDSDEIDDDDRVGYGYGIPDDDEDDDDDEDSDSDSNSSSF